MSSRNYLYAVMLGGVLSLTAAWLLAADCHRVVPMGTSCDVCVNSYVCGVDADHAICAPSEDKYVCVQGNSYCPGPKLIYDLEDESCSNEPVGFDSYCNRTYTTAAETENVLLNCPPL